MEIIAIYLAIIVFFALSAYRERNDIFDLATCASGCGIFIGMFIRTILG